MNNNFQTRNKRAIQIVKVLKKLYPHVKITLKYKNNWELLAAVILSAQCTDKMVNKVTEKLFKKYKTLDDYIKAKPKEFEIDIKSAGFYKNKAKNILASAKIIKQKHKGNVPHTMDDLLKLPGVARKTANVVLGNAFKKVEGIAVDTHVRRLALKFDLTESYNPRRIEKDLMKIIPKKEWFLFTYRAIEYGRHICPARKHDCKKHPLTKIYRKAQTVFPPSKK